ncbi:hypothetical protein D3C79_834530 [compost metagenome]
MLTLIGNHEAVGADILHGLRVAETGQWYAPQDAPIQRQLDKLRACIGDREQGLAVRVVGQRRQVIVQPLDRLRLDHYPITLQAHALLSRLPPGLEVEPAPLEQAELLPGQTEQEHTDADRDQ